MDLVAAYGAGRLASAIPALHEQLRSRGHTEPALAALPVPPPPEAGARRSRRRARAPPPSWPAAATSRASATRWPALERCEDLLDGLGAEIPGPARLETLTIGNGGAVELAGSGCTAYREALAAWTRACVDHRATLAWNLLGTLLRAYAAGYAELKAERSALDFADLELRVRDLLLARPDLRARQAERFALVMVDEFQDTNPLQAEILELIERDNLFAVGDEFQSIYGFRHADVEVIRARRARLEPAGRAATLARNFRGRPELLDALNHAFGPRFGGGFTPLEAGRECGPDGDAPRVELLVTDTNGWEEDPGLAAPPGACAWRLAEARLLARRVGELRDSGHYTAGDIVVLLRATGDMGVYERALADRGIPTYAVGGRGYWSQREVQDLVAWLSVLANPRDELRLYEVLASPLTGASSDALFLVAQSAGGQPGGAWRALEEMDATDWPAALDAGERRRLVEVRDLIAAERRGAPRRPVEELIDRAVTARGYDLALLSQPGGERRMANVRKLMRLARAHEAAEGRDLRGFLDHAAARVGDPRAPDREGEAPVESEDLDAVRLMTIHRAKGLEFPVVCVADLGRKGPGGADLMIRVGDDGRAGLRLMTLDGGSAVPALAYEDLAEEDRARDEEEERRLFYVAMTRAEEHLVLSGAIDCARWPEPRAGGPPLAWIARAFVPDIPQRLTAEEPELEAVVVADRRLVRLRARLNAPGLDAGGDAVQGALFELPAAARRGAEDAAEPAPALVPIPAPPRAPLERLSYSALQSYASCGYRFYLERVLGLTAASAARPASAGARACRRRCGAPWCTPCSRSSTSPVRPSRERKRSAPSPPPRARQRPTPTSRTSRAGRRLRG